MQETAQSETKLSKDSKKSVRAFSRELGTHSYIVARYIMNLQVPYAEQGLSLIFLLE
jgi:hypothetical protein